MRDPKLKQQSDVELNEIPINSLDPGTVAVGIFMNPGADASDAHARGGDVAIGWSLMSNGGGRLGRFRKRMNATPNAMAMAIPPMTPPAIAGAFDLREDGEGVDDAEWASVEDGASDVGVETINSGLRKKMRGA